MIKNKLIILLSTFSKKETTRFLEFIQSPYFNKRADVVALVQYLHGIYPNFTPKKCDRKKIFERLYTKQAYSQSALALVFTYTFRLAKKFLEMEIYGTQAQAKSLNLLQAIHQKGQISFYQKQFEEAQHGLEAMSYRNSSFYQYQYEFAKVAELDNQFYLWQDLADAQLTKTHNLDYFYIGEKLKTACELKVRSGILQPHFDSPLLAAIMDTLRKDWINYLTIPPIIIYYHIYAMLIEEDTTYYYRTLPLIEQNSNFFPRIELQEIYTYIQNYCIKQINQNKTEFMQELLNIYKVQLDRRLLQDEQGLLSEWHYKNIVTLGLRLDAVVWVNQFIERYKDHLLAENKENAYRFNSAAFAYHTGDYETVLALLLYVEYTNIQYGLGARWLLLRTYYELEEQAAFLSLCDSFHIYLQRNQLISDFKKAGNEQALRLVRKLFQLKLAIPYQAQEKSKKEWGQLQEELQGAEAVFNRRWLEDKLVEVRNYLNQ